MKLSRISRIVRILTLLQSGQSYSVQEFLKILAISRRTFFRDMKGLAAIGVPCHFDNQSGGYSLDPDYFLPSVDLTLQEALSFLLLVHKGRKHLPMPFQNSALLGGLKIENNLPPKIRNYCNASLDGISIKPDRHAPMERLDNIFAKLQNAIRKKRKIRLVYHSLYDGGDITLTLNPYHLVYNHRAWYIIGKSSIHNSIRTFKLNRITSIELIDKCFTPSRKFDIADYFGRAWSMIPEGKLYNIELRFTPKVARNVAEVRWHSTQQTQFNDDGSLTVQFRVDGLGEITWWILGYGDQVEVLKPQPLRKKIAQIADKMAKIHSKQV
jgi:predicted DNA-binding transcriptional regulator YafY